jgi:hypothetical protein
MTADPTAIFVSQLIEHRNNQSIPIGANILAMNEAEKLAELSLDGLCKTIWFFGHCITDLGKFGAGHGRKIYSIGDAQLAIRSTLQLLQFWPVRFGEKLEQLAMRQPSSNTDSLINRLLGPIHHYFQNEIDTAELTFLRTTYEQHIQRIWKKWDSPQRVTAASKQMELDIE